MDEEKEDLATLNEKSILKDYLKQMKEVNQSKTQAVFKRLKRKWWLKVEEKQLIANFWENDKERKIRHLNKLKFKNETSEEEEVFRFIFNN